MTMGGFTAFVKCTRSRLSGGLSGSKVNEDAPYANAEMDFEGRLTVFHYKELQKGIDRNNQPTASLEIEFTEKQETDSQFSEDDKPSIGTIRYFEDIERGVANATVRILLPLSMFPLLQAMRGELVKCETIHEILQYPTEHQKKDCIVALVKRVYFEVQADQDVAKRSKTFSISFG